MDKKRIVIVTSVVAVLVALWYINDDMAPSKQYFDPGGAGESRDHSWDGSIECPHCDATGFSSWHLFGFISETCSLCHGYGWIKRGNAEGDSDGSSFDGGDESNGSEVGSSSSQTGSVAATPYPMPASTSSYDESEYSESHSSTTRTCPSCNGTGKGMDKIVYAPNYTGEPNDEFCAECGSISSAHSHVHSTCPTCGGTGSISN